MTRLLIQDVRSFRGLKRTPVSPLTILVGENSTGKTTFLAMTRMIWGLLQSESAADFNAPPFPLGSYDQIARFHGGQGKRVKSFSLGVETSVNAGSKTSQQHLYPLDKEELVAFRATFTPHRGQPSLGRMKLTGPDLEVSWARATDSKPGSIEAKIRGSRVVVNDEGGSDQFGSGPFGNVRGVLDMFHLLRWASSRARREGKAPLTDADSKMLKADDIAYASVVFGAARRALGQSPPVALAPIRSHPERYYVPNTAAHSPDGQHMSSTLLAMHDSATSSSGEKWASLLHFGEQAGLFKGIEVRRLGNRESDPFQLNVKIARQARESSLLDVGYGVGQALPVVVDMLAHEKKFILVQQPEVHLHPRAQAQLGSLLCELVGQGKRLMVETHSDYLVNRVAMELRDGNLSPELVSVLYFENGASGASIHELKFDSQGELTSAPAGFRSFFLEEQRRFLGG